MKEDKILLNISNLSDLEDYKKLGISNFLFPLEGYSVGYNTYTLKEIQKLDIKCYLFINRILEDKDIDEFLKLDIPSCVVGIILEDIGLYYSLKDTNLELILFQNHLNNNYMTVNYWLKRFDSIVLSTDITYEEIKREINESIKPVVLFTYGYPMIMYSRRTLVSNYLKHENFNKKTILNIFEHNNNFKLRENEYGTSVFNSKPIDIRKEASQLDKNKIKFYLIDTNMDTKEHIIDIVKGNNITSDNKGFLYTKTVYRIGDLK